MAVIHKINRKKHSDYRTALLGLAADRPASSGHCLTPEEMARLVDEQCPHEIKEQQFQHLAACEICYGEWLALHEALKIGSEKQRETRVFKILSPRTMTFAGTLLAAVASVVIFLNIHTDVGDRRGLLMTPVAPLQQEASSPGQEKKGDLPDLLLQEDKRVKEESRKEAKSDEKPAASEEMPKRRDANDAARRKPERSTPQVPAAVAPAPPPASGVKETSVRRQSVPSERVFSDGGVRESEGQKMEEPRSRMERRAPLKSKMQVGNRAFSEWREQLRNGCAEKNASEDFWQELERQGLLFQSRGELLDQNEKEILDRLLPLLLIREKQDTDERCRQIIDLLADEQKNR